MNKLQRVWSLIVNPWKPIPSGNTIDQTGIVKSDYPKEGNGWIKGWVVNIQPKNIIIVCKHSNPSINSPNNKIFVVDNDAVKYERQIVAIDNSPFCLNGQNMSDDYYNGGDIAICKLNEPLPDSITGYDICTEENIYALRSLMFNQNGEESIAQIRFVDDLAYIKGKKRKGCSLIAGDSGMPWFIWINKKWKILTHTFRGQWGEGPWYGHRNTYEILMKRIRKIQDSL